MRPEEIVAMGFPTEQGYPIVTPSEAEIRRWLATEEASLVYRTLLGIDLIQHRFDVGFEGGLSSLYYDPEVQKLAPKEQTRWLFEQMPITDIAHAAFILDANTLLISQLPDNMWLDGEKAFAEFEDSFQEALDRESQIVPGMVATVKSNGWRIFDTMYNFYKQPTLLRSAQLLRTHGYVLLARPVVDKSQGAHAHYEAVL